MKTKKSVVKKSNRKTLTAEEKQEKQELLKYVKTLRKFGYNPVDRSKIQEDVPDKLSIECAERAILGDAYDKVMAADTRPDTCSDTHPDTRTKASLPIVNIFNPPFKYYGELSEVAVAKGIDAATFSKVVDLLCTLKIVDIQKILDYNRELREFVADMKKNKQEKETTPVENNRNDHIGDFITELLKLPISKDENFAKLLVKFLNKLKNE